MESKKNKRYRPRRNFAGLEKRRLKAATLFAQDLTQAEVARRLEVSRQATKNWFDQWKRGGRSALHAAGRAGRKPKLLPKQLQRVEKALLQGPRANGLDSDLWSLPRIAVAIERITGVRYHSGHVWKVMRALGWSAQKPQPKARERDEAAIHHWKTRTWPAIKKKPGNAARA
jgi:transposase